MQRVSSHPCSTLPTFEAHQIGRSTTSEPFVALYNIVSEPRVEGKPKFQQVAKLHGGHGEEIVRHVWLHADVPFMLTCGEDGQVRVWQGISASEDTGGTLNNTLPTQVSTLASRKNKKGEASKRYKPY